MRTEGTLKNWNDDRGFGFIVTTRNQARRVRPHLVVPPNRATAAAGRTLGVFDRERRRRQEARGRGELSRPADRRESGRRSAAPRPMSAPARAGHASRAPSRGNRHVTGRHRSRPTSPRRVGGLLTMLAVVGIGAAIVNRTGFGDPAPTTTPVTMVAPQNDAIDPPSPVDHPHQHPRSRAIAAATHRGPG